MRCVHLALAYRRNGWISIPLLSASQYSTWVEGSTFLSLRGRNGLQKQGIANRQLASSSPYLAHGPCFVVVLVSGAGQNKIQQQSNDYFPLGTFTKLYTKF